MVWPGVALIFAGVVATFVVDGHAGGFGVGAAGVAAMIAGAGLLVLGLVRLNRRGRLTRDRLTSPGSGDRRYRTATGKIIAMIAVVAYILSPIDVIPDVLLPVGIVDDATAFAWLLFAIGQEVSRHHRSRRVLERGGRMPR